MSKHERDFEEELLVLADDLYRQGSELKHAAQTIKTLREAHYHKDKIADAMESALELLKQYNTEA